VVPVRRCLIEEGVMAGRCGPMKAGKTAKKVVKKTAKKVAKKAAKKA
jgi:hypothetical protein